MDRKQNNVGYRKSTGSRGSGKFYKIFFTVVGVLVVGIIIMIPVLNSLLKRHELGLPKYKASEIYDKYFTDGNLDDLYGKVSGSISEFNSESDFIEYVEHIKEISEPAGGFSIAEVPVSAEQQRYIRKFKIYYTVFEDEETSQPEETAEYSENEPAGIEENAAPNGEDVPENTGNEAGPRTKNIRLLEFELIKDSSKSSSENQWIENSFTFYISEPKHARIRSLDGCDVFVNGKKVSDAYRMEYRVENGDVWVRHSSGTPNTCLYSLTDGEEARICGGKCVLYADGKETGQERGLSTAEEFYVKARSGGTAKISYYANEKLIGEETVTSRFDETEQKYEDEEYIIRNDRDYLIGGLIADPAVKVTDAYGNEVSAEFDVGRDMYSVRPATVKVLNGSTLYIGEKAIDPGSTPHRTESSDSSNRLPEGVEGITYNIYDIALPSSEGAVKTVDRFGKEKTLVFNEKDGSFTEAPSYNEITDDLYTRVNKTGQAFGKYMTLDGSMYEVGQYFETGSTPYNFIKNNDSWCYTPHNKYEFLNTEISEYYVYSSDYFSVRYKSLQVITRYGEAPYEFPIDVTLYYRKGTGGKFFAYEMVFNYS